MSFIGTVTESDESLSDKMTDFSKSITERQYLHKDKEGNTIEDIDGMVRRVAYHVARAEAVDEYKKEYGHYPEWYTSFDSRRDYVINTDKFDRWIEEYDQNDLTYVVEEWADKFYDLIASKKFIPAGRILQGSESNHGGAMNCFVLSADGNIIDAAKGDTDSIAGIYELAYKLAETTKRGGGCIGGESTLITSDGPISMREFCESGSDADVLSYSSRADYSRVAQKHKTEVEEGRVYKVEFSTGEVRASDWHPFFVWDGSSIVVKRADELQEGDAIIGSTRWAGEGIDLDQKAWVDGLIVSDGAFDTTSTSGAPRLRISKGDEGVISRAARALDKNYHYTYDKRYQSDVWEISTNGSDVRRIAERLSYDPEEVNCYNKHLPPYIWKADVSTQLSMIVGLLDGDGWYNKEKLSMVYDTVSERLAEEVKALAGILGLRTRSRKRVPARDNEVPIYEITFKQSPWLAELVSEHSVRHNPEYTWSQGLVALSSEYRDALEAEGIADTHTNDAWLNGITVGGHHISAKKWFRTEKCPRNNAAVILRELGEDVKAAAVHSSEIVKSVEREVEGDVLYDLTVPGPQNYIAGNDSFVVAHNTGIYLGNLRESGSSVRGSSGESSGPISFLRLLYATTLRVIKLAGVRRGAGMATLDIDHPDILDFITAKDHDREEVEGEIESFNISTLVTDNFMQSVEDDGYVFFNSVLTGDHVPPSDVPGKYHYPGHKPTSVTGNPNDEPTSKEIPLYFLNDGIEEVEDVSNFADRNGSFCVKARWLWEEIADHAHRTGDPGVIFIDRVNDFWPMRDHLGDITASNPCGEEFLAPGESCCLGSMVLPSFVTENGEFDYDDFESSAKLAVRFLDDVLTINGHPLEETQETCDELRRVGLGVMGDADMLSRMRVAYDSDDAHEIRNKVAITIRHASIEASESLALEKDEFPLWSESDLQTPRRNVHTTTIPPTGTTSMVADVSSGIEPVYALAMQRRVGGEYSFRLHPEFERYIKHNRPDLLDGKTVKYDTVIGVDASNNSIEGSIEIPAFIQPILENRGSIQGLDEYFDEDEQEIFKTAHDIDYTDHINAQSVWQVSLDGGDGLKPHSSISKTINLRNSATVEDVLDAYNQAHEKNLKAVSLYRDGSKAGQVLSAGSSDSGTDVADDSSDDEMIHPEDRPEVLSGETRRVETPLGTAYVTVNSANGRPFEAFVALGKAGGAAQADAEAMGRLISLVLRNGGSIDDVAQQLRGIRSDRTIGFGQNKVASVPDAIGKALSEYGSVEADNSKADLNAECDSCGGTMVFSEGCETCVSCGASRCS